MNFEGESTVAQFQSVRGSARKGFRDTHGKKPLPAGASSEHDVKGGSGSGVSSNVSGHGNDQKSGTPDGPGNGGESGSGMNAARAPAEFGRGPTDTQV